MIADPVIADLTAAPVVSGITGETRSASLFGRMRGDEESGLRGFVRLSGAGASDDRKTARSGQIGLKWLEGVDVYRALVEASVGDVGLFCVGKKGVPSLAVRSAA